MLKRIARGALEILVITIIVLLLSSILAYPLLICKKMSFMDALTLMGLIIAVIGGLTFSIENRVKKTRSKIHQNGGIFQGNYYLNTEGNDTETEITESDDNDKKHGLLQVTNRNLDILIGGIIVFIISCFI